MPGAPVSFSVKESDTLLWFAGLPRHLSVEDMVMLFQCLSLDKLGLLQHYQGSFIRSAKFYGSRLKVGVFFSMSYGVK